MRKLDGIFKGVKCMIKGCHCLASYKISEIPTEKNSDTFIKMELTTYVCEDHFNFIMTREENWGMEDNREFEEEEMDRGCCSECGEGYDNEEEWKYNTECELCGHPIPEHLIIKRP